MAVGRTNLRRSDYIRSITFGFYIRLILTQFQRILANFANLAKNLLELSVRGFFTQVTCVTCARPARPKNSLLIGFDRFEF